MFDTVIRVAVVGTGPRGLAVALRLLDSRTRDCTAIELHLIDPSPGGAVWHPDQDAQLLMNSRGAQATVFADDSVPGVLGPPRGPSFIEWCRDVAPRLPLTPLLREHAAALTDTGFASRALFGAYTRWVLGTLVQRDDVTLHPHRAIDLENVDGGVQRITLDDPASSVVEVDSVVLALGHLTMPLTEREQRLAEFARGNGLVYLPPQPANPEALTAVAPGQHVALLGAGLNFYDVMALLTAGRGGAFVEGATGGLHYRASGQEPVLLVASGRGIPYMGRAESPLPPSISHSFDELLAGWSGSVGTLSFSRDVWPAIVAELSRVWLEAGGGGPLDIDAMIDPYADALARRASEAELDSAELSSLLREILHRDAESASKVPRGAPTAVAETLAALKDRVRSLVSVGAFDAESVDRDLNGWFRSVGAFIAAGPPLRRVREAIALLDAGVLHALGAEARLSIDQSSGTFLVTTREIARPAAVRAVIEARLPDEDARTTADPLVRALLRRGLARLATHPHDASAEVPTALVTGGLEVLRTTAATLADGTACRLVSSDGGSSPRRFLIGLPVQPQEWNIANLPQPGRGDSTLTQAESIARQIDEFAATDARLASAARLDVVQ